MRSWMAVGLLALAVISAAAGGSKHAKVVDVSELNKMPSHFQAGNEYVFDFSGQIVSGLNEPSTTFESSNNRNNEQNPQKAMSRIQAQVQIQFISAQRAHLQLANVRLGVMNGRQAEDAKRIQPLNMFESRPTTGEQREQIEAPCAFDYVNGVVERIYFAANEPAWSKNIKRSILNLIQVNLSGKPSPHSQPRHYAGAFSAEVQPVDSFKQTKSFAVPETGIEGDCLTAYTVNGACWEQGTQSQEQQSNCNGFNVTKSVDFKQCSQIADVTFGYDSRNEQSQKCIHMSQSSKTNGPNAFPTTDDESCDPKQVNEENVYRSTVSRIECAGGNAASAKCAIKRAETLSHYVLKNSFDTQKKAEMHTIAISRLNFRGQRTASSLSPATRQSAGPADGESLMYDNTAEADQKRFYMLGDKCKNCEMRSKGDNEKVKTAVELYRKLIDATLNKRIGAEGGDATQIQRLIEILRVCSAAELQAIHKEAKNWANADEKRVNELQADALSAAGTRNAILALVKKIQDGSISPAQASKSLKNLNNMPAPSDEIASELWALCESESAQRSAALRQSCMLTFGSTVGKMCSGKISAKSQQREHFMQPRYSNDNDETSKELFVFGKQTGFNNQKSNKNNNNPEEELACAPHKKQFYKEVLIQQFNRASSIYEKILAIKTLGNAGLDNTIHELEAIITGRQGGPSPMVRASAVDALRRLRHQMPHKIQRICLPAYQNAKESQYVRSVCFHMLMSTQPSAPILDQILYTISKERSSQLQRVAFTTAQALAESPIGEHRQMAKHLKNALKLSGIDAQNLKAPSARFQIPLYSRANGDGFLINLLSMFSDVNSMPIHLSAGADAVFGGKRQENTFKLSMTQQGMAEALEYMVEAMVSQSQQSEKTRANRVSTNADAELRDIFAQLAIKSRQQKQTYGARDQSSEPFGMMVLRIGNMDQAILPLTADDAEAAAAFANNQSPLRHRTQATGASLWHSFAAGGSQGIRSLALTTVNDKSAFIPTIVGVPLKMTRASSLLTCIEANANTENKKVNTQGHVIAAGVHINKMESACLLGGPGVESARIFEANIPLNAQLQFGTDEQNESTAKLTWSVPQQKTRLLGVHTFMHTFTYESHKCIDTAERHTLTLQHPQLGAQVKQINAVVGERSLGIPLRISGHFAVPNRLSDPSAWLQLAMASENHLHVTLEPTTQTPKEISWQAQSALFRHAQSSHLVESLKKLDEIYQNYEQDFQAPFSQNDEKAARKTQQQRENLQKAIQKIAEQNANKNNKGEAAVYRHKMKLSVQTNGGARNANAELAIDATCDARFQTCASSIKVKRSPMYASESNNWQAEADTQIIWPEAVSSPAELGRLSAKKHQKFLARMNCQWGSNQEQSLKIRVQGQKTQWKYDNQVNNDNVDVANTNKRAAFINQFDVACDYNLEPQAQNFFTRCFETLKAYQFWNVEMPVHTNSRDGQAFARLHIEPKNAQKAHCKIRTPTQTVHIKNIQLPFQARPMPLIRSSHSSTHSVAQMFARAMRGATRAECAVSGHSVETFDGMLFNGPVTSSCYSVLAKDCANEQQPQYSVLMKSLESNGQQKKIKVIVPGQKIECQAKNVNSYDEFDGNKITCTINGKPVRGQSSRVPSWGKSSSEESEQPFKNVQTSPIVEFNNEERTAVTINAPSGALTVLFACQCADCKCQKAWIQLSSAFKNAQCGLCGHFDNDATNEWRSANNEDAAQDPVSFHRSYSIVKVENDDNEENVCTDASQDKFYEQHKQKFGFLKRPIKTINADGQWSDESNSNEDEGFFEPPQDYFGEYAHSDDSNENNYFSSKRQFSGRIIDPVMKTKFVEHHHQMCFSKSPVSQCPEGSSPWNDNNNKSNSDEEWSTPWNANDGTPNKMSYVCVSRNEAGPLIRAISSGHESRVSEILRTKQGTFSIVEREPTACRRH